MPPPQRLRKETEWDLDSAFILQLRIAIATANLSFRLSLAHNEVR